MLWKNSHWTPATLAILIATSCGGSAAPATSRSPTVPASASPAASVSPAASAATKPTDAVGQVSTKLADGPQQPGSPLQHAHIAGFVYVVSGTHRLALAGGDTKDSQPGQAVFVPQDVAHTHSNPGTTPSEWYFVALRNTNARVAAPTFPGQTTLYESTDLLANALPADRKYVEQLNLVTLEKSGRTASHKHGGVEMVVVTDGTIQLKASGQQPLTLTKGKGTVVPPNTVLQATNMGDGQAKFLAFFVTPQGADFCR